jgi:hypothetical protein
MFIPEDIKLKLIKDLKGDIQKVKLKKTTPKNEALIELFQDTIKYLKREDANIFIMATFKARYGMILTQREYPENNGDIILKPTR